MEIQTRRKEVESKLGFAGTIEQKSLTDSIERENKRLEAKQRKREEMLNSSSYRLIDGIATAMDRYFLDALIGLIPGVGDLLTSIFVLPFINVSLFKIKSIPLTLAILFNMMRDALLGMIPFWIGNIFDIFNRSFIKNMRLIKGFIDDDKEIISEVNRNAFWMAILIVLFGFLIYWLFSLAVKAGSWLLSFVDNLF
jgi:hypothetical protein